MGLNYEMALYTELTGEDGTKVPIGALGHFLWGYEIGLAKGRPKGEWLRKEYYFDEWVDECSECGEAYIMMDGGTATENGYRYCPNCGAYMVADMRGKE